MQSDKKVEEPASEKLNVQDKEHVKNIYEMFGEQHDRQFISKVYLQNNKDFEKTLNQFLTGDLPKTEIKVTIVET